MATSTPVQSPTSEDNIAAMFNRIAGRYDFLNRLLSIRQDVRWRRHLVNQLPTRDGLTLVDVATGTGDVLIAAAKKHPNYGEYVGVDISAGMLQIAEKKLSRHLSDKAYRLQKMSAESLAMPNETVDALTISFGLRNVVQKENALEEFFRVLRPNGTLVILEFFIPQTGLLARLFQFYFHQILPRLGALISDKEAYRYLPESVGSFYSLPELEAKLKTKGMQVIGVKNFLFGACKLITARKLPPCCR